MKQKEQLINFAFVFLIFVACSNNSASFSPGTDEELDEQKPATEQIDNIIPKEKFSGKGITVTKTDNSNNAEILIPLTIFDDAEKMHASKVTVKINNDLALYQDSPTHIYYNEEKKEAVLPLERMAPGNTIQVIVDKDKLVETKNDVIRRKDDPFLQRNLPDIEIVRYQMPKQLCIGDNIGDDVLVVISNTGNADIPNFFHMGWYLSRDPIIDQQDHLLIGGRDQPDSLTVNEVIDVPAYDNIIPQVPPGKYFLGVWADEQEQIEELNEANNYEWTPVTVSNCEAAMH